MKDEDKQRARWIGTMRSLAAVSQIGISFVVSITLGFAIGNYLDKVFHTQIIFMLAGTVIGIGAAFRQLFKWIK